jgi:hypothetical protein
LEDFSLDLSSMPDLNFRKKIIDVSKILKSWQHRKQESFYPAYFEIGIELL